MTDKIRHPFFLDSSEFSREPTMFFEVNGDLFGTVLFPPSKVLSISTKFTNAPTEARKAPAKGRCTNIILYT